MYLNSALFCNRPCARTVPAYHSVTDRPCARTVPAYHSVTGRPCARTVPAYHSVTDRPCARTVPAYHSVTERTQSDFSRRFPQFNCIRRRLQRTTRFRLQATQISRLYCAPSCSGRTTARRPHDFYADVTRLSDHPLMSSVADSTAIIEKCTTSISK